MPQPYVIPSIAPAYDAPLPLDLFNTPEQPFPGDRLNVEVAGCRYGGPIMEARQTETGWCVYFVHDPHSDGQRGKIDRYHQGHDPGVATFAQRPQAPAGWLLPPVPDAVFLGLPLPHQVSLLPGDPVIILYDPHAPTPFDYPKLGFVAKVRDRAGFGGCDVVDVRYDEARLHHQGTMPFAPYHLAPADSEALVLLADRMVHQAALVRDLATGLANHPPYYDTPTPGRAR